MAELALVARNEAPVEARARTAEPSAPAAPVAVAPDKPKRKRGRLIGGIGSLLLIVAGGLGYQYTQVWAHQETTDNAYVRADITPVAAKVEGYVSRLLVGDNQQVRAGDVLMVIEPADYQARASRAEAELASARASLQQLIAARGTAQAQVGAQGGAIAEAQARVVAARATATRASADERRFAALAKSGWTTRARLDQARAEAQSARAEIAAAEAAVAAQRGRRVRKAPRPISSPARRRCRRRKPRFAPPSWTSSARSFARPSMGWSAIARCGPASWSSPASNCSS
jgi:membrane fusion protein (multidrug efflux system)